MERYSPMLQYRSLDNPKACILCEEYPTLANIKAAYGNGNAMKWLIGQMVSLCQFCGVSDKLSDIQLAELAQILIHRYFYLKVTEFMLFFQLVKEGRYGKFYGSVDPQRLLIYMQSFIQDRNGEIDKYDQWKKDQQRQERKKGCITHRQWCLMSGQDPDADTFDAIYRQAMKEREEKAACGP